MVTKLWEEKDIEVLRGKALALEELSLRLRFKLNKIKEIIFEN